jgi:hypothetical protein
VLAVLLIWQGQRVAPPLTYQGGAGAEVPAVGSGRHGVVGGRAGAAAGKAAGRTSGRYFRPEPGGNVAAAGRPANVRMQH